jgi:hypothetical protein
MKTQHMFSASAAAVLAMTMAAFAQAPESASPATQTRAQADAQTSKQPATSVTLVGCVQREADYRKANDSGRGGPVATGVGLGNEFVLVNAMKTTAGGSASKAGADCSAAPSGGEAYELTGNRERDLAKYVGRRVEITGTMKAAKTTTAPAGEPKPTGGFDPLKQDLKLFEVEVASFREASSAGQSAAAPPSEPAPPARPASPQPPPAAAPAQPEPQPSPSAAPRQRLPRTASPLPLAGLIGLFSLVSGIALFRRG